MLYKVIAICLLGLVGSIFFIKMLLNKKKGIQTVDLKRGSRDKKTFWTERMMQLLTLCLVATQFGSILLNTTVFSDDTRVTGLCISFAGVMIFAVSAWTMRDSWRAGIPEKKDLEIITDGIYKYSRNPAFVGLYLLYAGILICFFNLLLCILTVLAITSLHMQVLQEEIFMQRTFGNTYTQYKEQVNRYF